MPVPYELIDGPCQAWIAPVATAFPAIATAPAAAWILLGTNGDKNITEDGLTIRHAREYEDFRAVGTTGVRKVFPTAEDLEVEFNVADATLEVYDKALGAPATAAGNVATTAGPPGYKTRALLRGFVMDTVALFLRVGKSAYGDNFNSQWEIPLAVQVSEPELVWMKGTPVAFNFHYRALQDPTNGFGNVRFQHIT